jgi:hypothetical protein
MRYPPKFSGAAPVPTALEFFPAEGHERSRCHGEGGAREGDRHRCRAVRRGRRGRRQRGQSQISDRLAAFAEIQARMTRARSQDVLWDEHEVSL